MADIDGKIDTDGIAKFAPTMELRYLYRMIPYVVTEFEYHNVLQQKWINELGDEDWRDIPLVISEL
jgi:hypothetical protein